MHPTCVYLGWDRYAAMFDFIAQRNGGMEVAQDFEIPSAEILPMNWAWHERVMVSTAAWEITRG